MLLRQTLIFSLLFCSPVLADFTANQASDSMVWPGASGPQYSLSPTAGDTYFIAPGAGTPSGFQLAGGPYEISTINGGGEMIGADFGGGMVMSSDTLVQNTAVNFDLTLRIESVGGNLLPTGIIGDSNVELTTLGIFVGGGVDPVNLDAPIIANSAQIEVFNTAGDSIGIIDELEQLNNFQTGIGGGWDGSLGLNFGNQIPIGDVGAIELQINYDSAAIPEPSALAIMGCAGFGLLLRRRK
ncbi:MAG: PEP-CTERM sorting domain-containing protein [Planctomycetota bacterium]